MNLLGAVAILSESSLMNMKFYMKAYLISHRWLWLCVPRWKAQNTCFLVSSKRGIQIEVSVSGLLEYGMTKGAIGSSVGINI